MNLFSFYLEFTYLANSSNSGVKQIFIDFEANGLQNKIFPALTIELITIMLKKQNCITANFILMSVSILFTFCKDRFLWILYVHYSYMYTQWTQASFDISTEDRISQLTQPSIINLASHKSHLETSIFAHL